MHIKTLLFHIAFWITYTAIFTFVEAGYQNQFKEAFLIEIAHMPVRFAIVYFNYFVLFPTYLQKADYLKYLSITLLTLILGAFFQRYLMGTVFNPIIFPGWDNSATFAWFRVLQAGIIITSPLIFIIGFTIISRWVNLVKHNEGLEREKKQAELQLLKSQLNPHFFFNTLNSLYGLAQEKSDKTEQVVLKLSDLMNYMLYETDHPLVALKKEVGYIKSYIELEEIRYGDRFTCNFSLSGPISEARIPPMLLLPFVENAFKHGINQESKEAWINMYIHIEDNTLSFRLENSLVELDNANQQNKQIGGIGIKNVEKRLKLLYQNDYSLFYAKKERSYEVDMMIKLEDNFNQLL